MLTYLHCSHYFHDHDDPDHEDVSPSRVHLLDRRQLFDILELADKSGIQLVSATDPELSLQTVLDNFDNEFHLDCLLSASISIMFNGHQRTAFPALDEPERALALVCAEALLQSSNNRTRSRIRSLLQL